VLGRLAILLAALSLGIAPAGALAAATARDEASTHRYLLASYGALHAVVTTWSSVEADARKLDLKLHSECPAVGAGSPQSEQEQELSTEVAGALAASYAHTDAAVLRSFVRQVSPLRWSSPSIGRRARRLVRGRRALSFLPIPNLCSDVSQWRAGGFGAAPASTRSYNQRVEAIDINEIPLRLLAPYERPADRALAAQVARLSKRFAELEFVHGQDDWNMLLETLALNQ
jgi:hypothetical protein